MENQIEKLMRILGITEAEAKEIIETDKRIDRGEKLFELSDELKAGAKKARQAERKPTTYDFSKRERKADSQKASIVQILSEAICENVADLTDHEIINMEREFVFAVDGRKFKVVLSCPRS